MRKLVGLTVALLLSLTAGAVLAAEEQDKPSAATQKQVLEGIESYVRQDVQLKGAFFLRDPRTSEPLQLAFDHVHSGIAAHSGGYVACVDFKDRAGKIHDVDFVVSPEGAVREISLHKVEGKPLAKENR